MKPAEHFPKMRSSFPGAAGQNQVAMRRIVSIVCALWAMLFFPFVPCFAEVHNIHASADYTMGDGETKSQAEAQALTLATRAAAEQVGVYVESYTEVENLRLRHDQIISISAAVTKVKEKSFAWSITPNGDFYVVCEIVAQVDDANIDEVLRNNQFTNAMLRKQVNELEQRVYAPENTNPAVEALIREGDALVQRDEYEAALAKYETAHKLSQSHIKAASKLIRCYALLRKYHEAARFGQEMLKAHPANVELLEAVGNMYCWAGSPRHAKKALKKAIEYGSKNPVALAQLGWCYGETRDFDDAFACYRESLKMAPKAYTYHLLGLTYEQKGDYENAIQAYQQSLALDNHQPIIFFLLGMAHYRSIQWNTHEHLSEAIDFLNRYLNTPRTKYTPAWQIREAERVHDALKKEDAVRRMYG